MNSKGLLGLLATTVVVVGGAVYLRSRDTGAEAPGTGALLYPELAAAINEVELVSVQTADGTSTLVRGEGGWSLEEWQGFPAKLEAVRKTLVALTQLRIEEQKTSRPDRYAALGVQDPSEPGATSTRLRLRTPAGATVADLIVGERRAGRSPGVYVRRHGEEPSWLVQGDLGLPTQPAGWVDAELVRLPAERIVRVDVNHPDGEWLGVVRSGTDDWKVEALPEGSNLRYDGIARSLGGALSFLSLESIAAADAVTVPEEQWTATRFETEEGLVVTVKTAAVGETSYARFAVGQVEPQTTVDASESGEGQDDATAGETDADGEGATADVEEPQDEPIDVAAEKARLAARLEAWTFVLPKWKADALRKRMADMLELPPEPEPDPAPLVDEPLDLSGTEELIVPALPGEEGGGDGETSDDGTGGGAGSDGGVDDGD